MGKSKSNTYPAGKRKRDEEGKKLAPRSIRRHTDKRYLEQCTDKEIEKYTGMNANNVRNETQRSTDW